MKLRKDKILFKTIFSGLLVFCLAIQAIPFSGFEAHVINVTARIVKQPSCVKINEVFYRPKTCGECCPAGDVTVVINNQAEVVNDVSVLANTGGNSVEGGGEIITGDVTAGASVVNEVNTNVVNIGGCDCQCDYQWIELYNACQTPVNLKNWYLENRGGEDYRETVKKNHIIQPGQFVLLSANASLWQKCWDVIPANAIKIALGGKKIFNGLRHKGDRVFLFDDNGQRVDEVSWGDDTLAFDPSVPKVAEGYSMARSPAGYDTDQASDWVELSSPNPGTNPHNSSEQGGSSLLAGDGGGSETFVVGGEETGETGSVNSAVSEDSAPAENGQTRQGDQSGQDKQNNAFGLSPRVIEKSMTFVVEEGGSASETKITIEGAVNSKLEELFKKNKKK